MLRWFWRLYWKLSGWKFIGEYPYHQNKLVIAAAPHTSSSDVWIGLAARAVLKIEHVKFLGKKELFQYGLGWLFKSLGAVPVDRSAPNGVVGQVVEMFNKNDSFTIALAPEGTRKKVDKLKTGFYQIAKQAEVPLLLVGIDFGNKAIRFSELIFPTTDEFADFNKILSFFAPIDGKHPELGLKHLLKLDK
jgi:1-acyl-sn-glycerol-3-phosphate acyltransferase